MIDLSNEKVSRLLRRLYTSNDGKELIEFLQALEFDYLQRSTTSQSEIISRQNQGRALMCKEFYEALIKAKS
jgi:hypothetical protein